MMSPLHLFEADAFFGVHLFPVFGFSVRNEESAELLFHFFEPKPL